MLFIFIYYKDIQKTTIISCLSLFVININKKTTILSCLFLFVIKINKTQLSYVVYFY